MPLVLVGCSTSKSESVSVGADGSSVTVTAPDGTRTSSTTNPDGSSNVTITADNGEQATMSTGKDGSVTEAEIGVPFYPGSTEKPGSSFKVEVKGEKDYSSVRTTTDNPAKVADFYKEKVKGSTSAGSADMMIVTGRLESGGKFSMTAIKAGNETTVTIGVAIKTN